MKYLCPQPKPRQNSLPPKNDRRLTCCGRRPQETLQWSKSREFFYWRLKRDLDSTAHRSRCGETVRLGEVEPYRSVGPHLTGVGHTKRVLREVSQTWLRLSQTGLVGIISHRPRVQQLSPPSPVFRGQMVVGYNVSRRAKGWKRVHLTMVGEI